MPFVGIRRFFTTRKEGLNSSEIEEKDSNEKYMAMYSLAEMGEKSSCKSLCALNKCGEYRRNMCVFVPEQHGC